MATLVRPVRLGSARERSSWYWEATGFASVLGLSAVLNLWNLSENGWGNAFYTAAVQSGLHNRESFVFGASDWGNSITVDKPPLSLWLIGLFVRILGFNSWGILVPQALLGVATTALIYRIIRRRAAFASAFTGALTFATTPIVVLLSRYNNPDPLLIFLMTLALWAVLRGIESHRLRWFVVAGLILGLGFMTKQLQMALVAPALGLALGASYGIRHRWKAKLAAAAAATLPFVAVAGSWLAFVDLTPASMRPYVGSSSNNSLTQLTFDYNGLQRITGSAPSTPVSNPIPHQYVGSGDDSGLLRLFNGNYNQEASWTLPLALVSAFIIVWALRRTAAGSLAIASSVWLITVYVLLSFMGNDIHTYYTINLSAPLALTVGLSLEALHTRPSSSFIRASLATGIALSTVVSWLILDSLDAGNLPRVLAWILLALGLAGTALTAVRAPRNGANRMVAAVASVCLAVGPMVTNLATLDRPQAGSNPVSGSLTQNPDTMSHFLLAIGQGNPEWARDISRGAVPPEGLVSLLGAAPISCHWSAATYTAQTAANWQIAANRPIMPIGGFSASDPNPALSEFQKLVHAGSVCYFIDYPELDPEVNSEPAAGPIIAWVRNTFIPHTMGGVTYYKLTTIP